MPFLIKSLENICLNNNCDNNDDQRIISEYVFNNQKLFNLLPKLDNNNEHLEYYLPDILSMIVSDGGKIGLEKVKNIVEIQGVNTLGQLSYLENIYEKNN